MRLYVFVAGPIRTSGILEHNVRDAAHVASCLSRAGFVPFVPHLNILWNFVDPLPEAHWKAWDKAWLERCDALYRIRGESVGADEEVAEAKRLRIPVFEDIESIVAWQNRRMDEHAKRGTGAAWTTERPTKPGWYWTIGGPDWAQPLARRLRIVEVIDRHGLVVRDGLHVQPLCLDRYDGAEWQPLPPPAPARQEERP